MCLDSNLQSAENKTLLNSITCDDCLSDIKNMK